MRRRRVRAATALLLAVTAFPGWGRAAERLDDRWVPAEALVRFDLVAGPGERAAALSEVGGGIERHIDGSGWVVVRLPSGADVQTAVETLHAHDAVAVAEPNYRWTLALTPDDPCIEGCSAGRQWNLAAVNAEAGWDAVPGRFYTSSEKRTLSQIKVAVLDTKIDVDHREWLNREPLPVNEPADASAGGQLDLGSARDFVPAERQQGSADYHGTFVAGIIAASANNGAGVAGLGYRATIVPVTVVDGGGVAEAADVAAGIMHARSVGVRVINLSLGLRQSSSAVQDAIHLATASGALVVAAAGNAGNDQPFYPAWHANVLSVSSIDEADRPAPCSNHNDRVGVAAPGMGILSLDPRAHTGYSVAGCGTSTATPHASALAALLFAQYPGRTPADVRGIITRTADDDRYRPGRDDYFGAGRLNFQRALLEGVGPQVDRVVATVPRALGGKSVATATATVTGDRTVLGAEWFVDHVGAPGAGTVVHAADGAFDEVREDLRLDIEVPLSYPAGVHRLFVRSRDASGWGPASVGVLIVDKQAPQITEFGVSHAAPVTAGLPVEVTFRAIDDWADTLSYTVALSSLASGEIVYVSATQHATPGNVVFTFIPQTGSRGPHMLALEVRDEGLNPARRIGTTILL